ncbi:POK9 protein, partial [Pomatostomus ruficeps]|nr:POK9 protein [Pomatostomus ruficeps]
GSLGIDLATAVDVTLMDNKVQKIPTEMSGYTASRYGQHGALLIGRSSSGLAGLTVLPGVIDMDFTGEVHVCAYTLTPPLTITNGTKIAQLVLIENLTPGLEMPGDPPQPFQGDRAFGSTGNQVVSLAQKMTQRPLVSLQLTCQGQTHTITVMMDTGADITIIS